MQLRIKDHRQVLMYTALTTLLAVGAPMFVVATTLSFLDGVTLPLLAFSLTIAGAIPLLIAPPLAYGALSILRLLHETLDKVDANVRFDGLTGVLNRSHLLDNIRSRMGGGVLLMVDVDHFKCVNDSFGHAVGDEALMLLASTLTQVSGPRALVGRLGGEEFAVFMPGANEMEGRLCAERICSATRDLRPLLSGHSVRLTVSIGGAVHGRSAMLRDTLKAADDRLYKAKHVGRDCSIFDDHVPARQLDGGPALHTLARSVRA